jgi:hypothetical protein
MPITGFAWIQNGLPNQNGKGTVSVGRGTYPASTASATLTVGNIGTNDQVEVKPLGPATGLVGLTEIYANRSNSNAGQGVVTIGNIDGTTGSASTVPFEIIVYRN